MTRTSSPMLLLFALILGVLVMPQARAQTSVAAAEAGLAAFVLDFRQDGFADPGGERVVAAYAAACELGHALSCEAEGWANTGALEAVRQPAETACVDTGDPVACVVAGWAWSQRRPGEVDAELETTRLGRDRFRAACDAGMPRGCTDLALLELALAGEDLDAADLALGRLRRSCQAGEGRACHYVARRSENASRKVWWLEQGCKVGDARSCASLAGRLRMGEGVFEDDEEALRLSLEACDQGFGEACTQAGAMIEYGEGLAKDPDRAVREYQRACRLKDPRGCTRTGARLTRVEPEDSELLARGLEYLERGCGEGDGDGCWLLGERTIFGPASVRERAAGVPWLERGCEEKSDHACAALGQGLALGVWDSVDLPGAAAALQRGCGPGEGGLSCTTLAHLVGEGAVEEERSEVALLERACELESGRGCHALGRVLAGEVPVDSDHPEGEEILDAFERACRFGFRPSCDVARQVRRAVLENGEQVQDPGARPGLATQQEAEFGPATDVAGFAALARRYAGIDETDRPEATPELRVATCALGFDRACLDLVTEMHLAGSVDLVRGYTAPLARACGEGVGEACEGLALLALERGDAAGATAFYDKGCTAGRGTACLSLGERTARGQGVRRSTQGAAVAYAAACRGEPRVAEGCTRAWELAAKGTRLGADEAAHIEALAGICTAETPAACLAAAQALQARGEGQDGVRAVELSAVACSAGLAEACPDEGAAGAGATVRTRAATVMGPVATEIVAELVKSRMASVSACYQAALQEDPTLEGTMVFQLMVRSNGDVASAVQVVPEEGEPDISLESFVDCIGDRLEELRFPPHDGPRFVFVAQPFIFELAEEEPGEAPADPFSP